MSIALFASSYYPHIGGVEEVVRQLAHQQKDCGDRPLIVTNRWPKDLPAQEELEGVPVRRFRFRVPEWSWKQMGGALIFEGVTLRYLCSELVRHQAEVLHVHCVSSNAYYALKASRRLKLPLVVTLHSELTMDAGRLFQRSEFARKLMRDVLREADAITAVSAKTLADAEEFFGESLEARASVILNGTNSAEFDNASPYCHNRPYLLAMGRLVPQKGFEVLLRAFAAARITTHDLLLAGDGAEMEPLKRLAEQMGISNRALLLGRAERRKALSLMKGSEFFVMPSCADEGLPMVLLEAMTAGKAVIASNLGGVPELVRHEETGLLVTSGDVEQLASGLQRLCADSALCNRLGESGQNRVRAFDWSAIAKQYAEVYVRVAGTF